METIITFFNIQPFLVLNYSLYQFIVFFLFLPVHCVFLLLNYSLYQLIAFFFFWIILFTSSLRFSSFKLFFLPVHCSPYSVIHSDSPVGYTVWKFDLLFITDTSVKSFKPTASLITSVSYLSITLMSPSFVRLLRFSRSAHSIIGLSLIKLFNFHCLIEN